MEVLTPSTRVSLFFRSSRRYDVGKRQSADSPAEADLVPRLQMHTYAFVYKYLSLT